MDWIEKTYELKRAGKSFALATVIDIGGSTPREIGAKMLVLPGGEFHGTVGGGELERQTLIAAAESLQTGESKMHTFSLGAKTGQCCGGVAEIFIEIIKSGPPVYIFGGGHVGLEVGVVLQGTQHSVCIIEPREEWAQKARALGLQVISQDLVQFASTHQFTSLDRVAVMTHSHDIDLELVIELSSKNILYLGLIGSQSKWLRFQQRMKERNLSQEQISRIECPLGLPIGGKIPREVAISLAARLVQLQHGK